VIHVPSYPRLPCLPPCTRRDRHDHSRTRKDQSRSLDTTHVNPHARARARERHSLAEPYQLRNNRSTHALHARAPWP
jgi:hypothetical protein